MRTSEDPQQANFVEFTLPRTRVNRLLAGRLRDRSLSPSNEGK
jgi:hypothetical protein